MWDSASELVIRTFMPPRGTTVFAGGKANAATKAFSLEATAGDEVFGICSSPFLTTDFKTVPYTLAIKIFEDDAFHYEEHSWLKMKNRSELFDHNDENTLRRLRDL